MTDERVRIALQDLFAAVDAEWKEIAESSAKNRRQRAIAKAVCRQDGRDPNVITCGIPNGAHCIGGNNAVAIVHPMQPAWATYWQEAHAAIEAVDSTSELVDD